MADIKVRQADLGPWGDANLDLTAYKNVGVGVDADLPEAVRFFSGVVKLVRRRLAEDRDSKDPHEPAVFLLQPSVPTQEFRKTPVRVPMLDNGLTPVAGRLWFVTEAVVSGKFIKFENYSDDELFRFVTDEIGIGSAPTIIYDPRPTSPVVRFYPNGLADPDTVETRAVLSEQITLRRILEKVEEAYRTHLITPEAQSVGGKLWQNSRRWWPTEHAERTIQLYLKVDLFRAFPTCVVREEQTQTSGRLDLEIEESDPLDPSQITRHAILELKVLRSFGSTGIAASEAKSKEWVEEGVMQAASYREERDAVASALCCFDMRRHSTGEQCFADVRERASRLTVELRVWYLYASSAQYRAVLTRES